VASSGVDFRVEWQIRMNEFAWFKSPC